MIVAEAVHNSDTLKSEKEQDESAAIAAEAVDADAFSQVPSQKNLCKVRGEPDIVLKPSSPSGSSECGGDLNGWSSPHAEATWKKIMGHLQSLDDAGDDEGYERLRMRYAALVARSMECVGCPSEL